MSCSRLRGGPQRSAQCGERTAGVRLKPESTSMQLITSAQRQKLIENGSAQLAAIDREDQVLDFEPVVKLFTPDGNATWLLTEIDNAEIDLAFGLCDLGLGSPELGYL